MEGDKGRCINCGFLGKKDIDGYGQECYIASSRNREEGNLSHHIILSKLQLDTIAWCYVAKADIMAEISQMDESKPQQERILKAIIDNRRCSSWYQWKEFMWPKEHFEEFKMQQLENDRKGFELRLTQMQIDASAEVSKAGLKVGRVGIWIGIGAAILAVAEVLTMTEEAILWKWIANLVSLIQGWF